MRRIKEEKLILGVSRDNARGRLCLNLSPMGNFRSLVNQICRRLEFGIDFFNVCRELISLFWQRSLSHLDLNERNSRRCMIVYLVISLPFALLGHVHKGRRC